MTNDGWTQGAAEETSLLPPAKVKELLKKLNQANISSLLSWDKLYIDLDLRAKYEDYWRMSIKKNFSECKKAFLQSISIFVLGFMFVSFYSDTDLGKKDLSNYAPLGLKIALISSILSVVFRTVRKEKDKTTLYLSRPLWIALTGLILAFLLSLCSAKDGHVIICPKLKYAATVYIFGAILPLLCMPCCLPPNDRYVDAEGNVTEYTDQSVLESKDRLAWAIREGHITSLEVFNPGGPQGQALYFKVNPGASQAIQSESVRYCFCC